MIQPTTLNVLIVGAMMIIFTFLWRMAAAHTSETSIGKAMAVVL
jgi:hypothetical protein